MVTLESDVEKLIDARRAHDEAREKSRASMLDSMAQYELVIRRMKREKIDKVEVGGVTITLRGSSGVNFLEFEDAAHPESNRPEFGGIKGNHEKRGQ